MAGHYEETTMLDLWLYYFSRSSVLCAVCLPAAVSMALVARYRNEFTRELLAPFVIGTAMSIFLPMWRESPDGLALHLYPACTLILVAMPRPFRPTWKVGYALSFASLLLSDVICTARYYLSDTACSSPEFFCGVGGAGLQDALFWVPLLSAAVLGALQFAEARGGNEVQIRMPFARYKPV
jgi:hypothetical protein